MVFRLLKNEKKEYLKRIGVKFSREERKEIKKMLNSSLTLEQFKLCVTPVAEENRDGLKIKKLNLSQMKEIQKGFEKGLSEEEVELYIKSEYSNKAMNNIRNILEIGKNKEYLKEYLILSDIKEILKINPERLEEYIKESKMNELRNKADSIENWYEAEAYVGIEKIEYYSSEKIRDDKEYVINKVKEDGKQLEHASIGLKNNKEVVLEAVRRDGQALQYASEELKNDKEVVIESVKNYPNSYQYASAEMQKDKDVIIEVMIRNEDALNYGDEEIKQKIDEIKKNKDFDKLTDREEIMVYGTNSYLKDLDSDGKTYFNEIKINYTNPKTKSKNIEIER